MTRTRGSLLVCSLAAALAAFPIAAPARAADAEGDRAFTKLGDAFLDHLLETRPEIATRLGVHERDDQLIPVTESTIAADVAWHHVFRERLASIPRSSLSFERALEYDLLAARTDRELLELETIRPFERDPSAYLDLIADGVSAPLRHDFASACRRVSDAARRLRQVPEVLRAARINLEHPSPIATEVAIERFEDVLELYRRGLGADGSKCRDPGQQAGFAEADSLAVRAVEGFVEFLREDLLPRSDGSFALGREAFASILAYGELETTSVDSLLARGRAELASTRARLEEVAMRVAPGLGVRAALDSLAGSPDFGPLAPRTAAELERIREFLRTKALVSLPPREELRVRETPGNRRSPPFASIDAPGVWERGTATAYYDVTPADSEWTSRQQHDHFAFFGRWNAAMVALHEGRPGRYYQFLALRRVPSRLRQFLGAEASSEGWGLYCEQMAIEEGFGGEDPRYALAQLARALTHLGRLVAGISLHTQGMTHAEARELFENACALAPEQAAIEARRCALDPASALPMIETWRILELREELRTRLGPRFRLKDFHDAYLREGGSAVPVIRAGLLNGLVTVSR